MRLLLTLIAVTLGIGVVTVGGASARTQTHWIHFTVHLNAYDHWARRGGCLTHSGGQLAYWDSPEGSCSGLLEEGKFLDLHFPHSSEVTWSWNGEGSLTVHGPNWYVAGRKPHNWYWLDVGGAKLGGKIYVSGNSAAAGEPNGPLYVTLTSKTYFDVVQKRSGMVLNLRGYLRLK